MQNVRMFRFSLWAIAVAIAVTTPAWAQSKPKAAAIAFQLQPSQLMASDLGKMAPIEEMTGGGTDNEFAQVILKSKSFRGIVTLPNDIEALMFPDGGQVPVDLYVELEFDGSEESKKVIADLEKELTDKSNIRKVGDYRYFSPKDREANMELVFDIPNKLVFMSDTYEYDPKNLENVSPAIKDALGKLGNVPFAVVLDFDAARPLIKAGVQMVRQDSPPPVLPFLEIPGQISLLQLVGNPGKEPAISLTTTSPDEEDAEMLRETLQGLIGLGKMAAQSANPNDPTTPIVNQVLGQLKPTRTGKVVNLSLSKIEGLEDLLGQ